MKTTPNLKANSSKFATSALTLIASIGLTLANDATDIADEVGEINDEIRDYNGYDPAVRFAQLIVWIAETAGPNITPDEEPPEPSPMVGGQKAAILALIPSAEDNVPVNHRVLVPLLPNAEGSHDFVDGQVAYLEAYDRSGLRHFPLRVRTDLGSPEETGDYVILTPNLPGIDAEDQPPFAIGLACDRDGCLDWKIPPVMLNSEDPDPSRAIHYEVEVILPGDENLTARKMKYDDGFIAYLNSENSFGGSNDDHSGDADKSASSAASNPLRDVLVDIWDGVSGGLASIGWGSGGSIETLTNTLGGQ